MAVFVVKNEHQKPYVTIRLDYVSKTHINCYKFTFGRSHTITSNDIAFPLSLLTIHASQLLF